MSRRLTAWQRFVHDAAGNDQTMSDLSLAYRRQKKHDAEMTIDGEGENNAKEEEEYNPDDRTQRLHQLSSEWNTYRVNNNNNNKQPRVFRGAAVRTESIATLVPVIRERSIQCPEDPIRIALVGGYSGGVRRYAPQCLSQLSSEDLAKWHTFAHETSFYTSSHATPHIFGDGVCRDLKTVIVYDRTHAVKLLPGSTIERPF
jgi:hypothetical protein